MSLIWLLEQNCIPLGYGSIIIEEEGLRYGVYYYYYW